MADPVAVLLPLNIWTKVATAATQGNITVKEWQADNYMIDYRATGEPTPTDLETSIPMTDGQVSIQSGSAIDVYFYPLKYAGEVVVSI